MSNELKIKFWGVRGSYPTPGAGTVKFGGNTACVEIRAGARTIILDAGTGADIDTLKQREANALHEAQHEDLTGLPNRRLLAERAAAALATSELRRVSCAVLAIDLDGFKDINDRHGHEIDDLMLREIAVRLTRVMRPQDTVAAAAAATSSPCWSPTSAR